MSRLHLSRLLGTASGYMLLLRGTCRLRRHRSPGSHRSYPKRVSIWLMSSLVTYLATCGCWMIPRVGTFGTRIFLIEADDVLEAANRRGGELRKIFVDAVVCIYFFHSELGL